MESVGLVGGTFEFFHIGHQKLIETGLSHCDNIEIWVISDEIAQQKDPRISSWKERCDYIQSNLPLEDNSRVSCLLYTSPSPRDLSTSRMPSSA